MCGRELAKRVNRSAGLVSKPEILTHNDALGTESVDQDLVDKFLRTQLSKFLGERQQQTRFNAGHPNELDAAIYSSDVSRHRFGSEQARGMPIEGDHDGVQTALFGNLLRA